MISLSDKLKSLGVKIGAKELPPPKPGPAFPIETVISGKFLTTPPGRTFVYEKDFPVGFQHGRFSLQFEPMPKVFAEWVGKSLLTTFSAEDFAFLDTETTGLAGGSGTYAFMIGLGRFEDGSFRFSQFFMRDPIEEPAQLAALADFLRSCRALVTFNGKTFDVPLLESRFITNGLPSPLSAMIQVDLLHLSRRLWADRLESCALGQLEKHILGIIRSDEDIEGWMIPGIYFDYLRSGDARPLKRVFYHNEIDIISLAALLNYQANILAEPFKCNFPSGLDWIALGKLFEKLSYLETAAQLIEKGLECDLSDDRLEEALQRLSFIYKRGQNYGAAVKIWQPAAGSKHIYAFVELAKYHEHRQKDFQIALEWTEAALDTIRENVFSRQQRSKWMSELIHRRDRLRRKCAKQIN